MEASSNMIMMLLTNTMGESILVETLKAAAYFISRSANSLKPKHHVTRAQLQEGRYCYYFIQGTGLDILIEEFELEYDPETLRNSFNYFLRHPS